MTDLPAAAVAAAAYVIASYGKPVGQVYSVNEAYTLRVAQRALAAAAPHITAAATAAERDRLLGSVENAVEESLTPRFTAIVDAAKAAERQRIIALASQLRATIPADHPEGAQASFADYLRVTSLTEGDIT